MECDTCLLGNDTNRAMHDRHQQLVYQRQLQRYNVRRGPRSMLKDKQQQAGLSMAENAAASSFSVFVVVVCLCTLLMPNAAWYLLVLKAANALCA